MRKLVACAALSAVLALTVTGCAGKAEVATPAGGDVSSSQAAALTDEAKLKELAVGETAVWRSYEVAVTSIDRADSTLTAHITVKSRGNALSLSTDCMLSFGMEPTSSSFANGLIEVPAGGEVSGTLTFDDQYNSQRLFWNDGATEAMWLLDKQAQTPANEEEPKQEQQSSSASSAASSASSAATSNNSQEQAVAAIEQNIPQVFVDQTYYTFQSLDPATAIVTPLDGGGYSYENDIAILDGNGEPATTHIVTRWDANGTLVGFVLDGVEVM